VGLNGNLKTMALGDIIQWIALGSKTGTLHVAFEGIEKRITFRDGVIIASWSNDPRESLGQFLIRERRVTEELLFKGLLQQEKEGRARMLGQILVTTGVLTEEQLKATLKAKAEETVYDLFLWEEGDFQFAEGQMPDTGFAEIHMPPTGVMLEGVRRIDEWTRIRRFFPTSAVRFKVQNREAAENDEERRILDLLSGNRTLAELSLELRRSEFDTAAILFDLFSRGLITIASTGEKTRASTTLQLIREKLKEADAHRAAGAWDSAIKAYESVLIFDRLNQHAKKGIVTVIEERGRKRTRETVDQTKIPHLKLAFEQLTEQKFDPQEGFLLSRVNGQWDVASILKLCPMSEEDTLAIFARLVARGVIELRD
jgi:Domain of unknown function (DUF4388)